MPTQMPLFNHAPQSICFLRLSAIGDVCHAVASIQAVQRHWPETKITWIIGKIEASMLEGIEGIELIVFDKKQGKAAYQDVWRQLKGRQFDALVHMQLALRASLLTLGIKARYKVGFHKSRAKEGQWLFTNKKIHDTTSVHVLDSFLSFAEYLGVPKQAPQWQMPIPESAFEWVTQTLPDDAPMLVISPAASKDERNWLTERYAQLAHYALNKGYQVVLCGSPSEREIKLADAILGSLNTLSENETSENKTKQALKVHNLVGKTNLKQLLALLKRADIVLAPDSGPAHMATTQGTPVIGLYAHSNPKRTGPYNSMEYVANAYDQLVLAQHGKTAEQLPWATRVKGEVMDTISIQEVIDIFDILDQKRLGKNK